MIVSPDRPRRRAARGWPSCLLALWFVGAAWAASAQSPAAPADPLEPVRREFESVLDELASPEDPGVPDLLDYYTDRLVALGPDVVPFLIAELELDSPVSFNIMAYALGRIGGPEAVEALRHAVRRADEEPGKFAAARKSWAAYGLAMAGDVGVLPLVDSKRHALAGRPFMGEMRLLEVVALLTAPESLSAVLERLETTAVEGKGEGEDEARRLRWTLRALVRFGDPELLPTILRYRQHEVPAIRWEVARAAGLLGEPAKTWRPLVRMLDDEHLRVRLRAVQSLEALGSVKARKALLARLEIETESDVRGALYRALARLGDDSLLEVFRRGIASASSMERVQAVRALGRMRLASGLNLLRAALRDPEPGVAIQALHGLDALDTPAARDTLLAQLGAPRWPIVEETIRILVRRGVSRAAPRIARLLVEGELTSARLDVHARDRVRILGEALLSLGYADPADDIAQRMPSHPDLEVREYLAGLVRRLKAVRTCGAEVACWAQQLHADRPEMRILAARSLGRLGGPAAVRALVDSLDPRRPEEALEVLAALASLADPAAAPAIRRALLDPTFDAPELSHARSMAAWAARRIGGETMVSLLEASAQRRDGRDLDVLVYRALAAEGAAPLVEQMRPRRLRYHSGLRGVEDERLLEILRDLRIGRRPEALDQPPDVIALAPW